MLVLYFSGTGNSKYVAESFAKKTKSLCHSIEEDVDFVDLINKNKNICFSYPIYGSCIPKIMEEFLFSYRLILKNKRLIILSTQMMFSGNGAKQLWQFIPNNKVLYADHINMPNNISNVNFLPITEIERKFRKKQVDKKINKILLDLKNRKTIKKGWSNFSNSLGNLQRKGFPKVMEMAKSSFCTTDECTGCGLCVRKCPVNNLTLEESVVIQHNKCILCYRCVNICPEKAACVLVKNKPRRQYKGIVV